MKNYNLCWLNDEQTILYGEYPPNWSWDDFYLIREQAQEWVEAVDSPRVDFVADLKHTLIPKGSPFGHAQTVTRKRHPRMGLVVVVTQQNIVRAIAKVALSMSADSQEMFRLVETVDDAITLIHQIRQQDTR